MTILDNPLAAKLDETASAFVDAAVADAEYGYRLLRETGSLSAHGTIAAAERIPGTDLYALLPDPGPWASTTRPDPVIIDLDGQVGWGPRHAAGFGFEKVFAAHPEISTIVHVHSPYLGAWSQTHRPLPIRYVPVQRWTLASDIPIYIDRTQSQVDFINARLVEDPQRFAILEANGGATVWGRHGLLRTLEYVQLVEEGAQFQILAEALGGSQEFGPGVIAQQWRMSGLYDEARELGRIG